MTVEQAQDEIARAKAELEPLATKTESKAPAQGSAEKKAERTEDACSGPCRALASMKRAVESLCRLTGETDARCVEARKTLETSTSRVAACACR